MKQGVFIVLVFRWSVSKATTWSAVVSGVLGICHGQAALLHTSKDKVFTLVMHALPRPHFAFYLWVPLK